MEKDDSGNYCTCFVGYNRTGKTSKAKDMLAVWRKSNPEGQVIKFDPQSKMREKKYIKTDKFIYDSDDNFHDKIYFKSEKDESTGETKYVPRWDVNKGALLILDDYRLLNESDKALPWLKVLMNFKAAWNLDVIYICHSPKQIIPYITTYTTHYYIFYTKATEGAFDERVPEVELCNKCCNIMRAYRKLFGRGHYPDFPFTILVTEEEKIFTQNISKEQYNTIKEYLRQPKQKQL